jgi:hypothetical protein
VDTDALTKAATVTELVAAYTEACATIRAAYSMLAGAQEQLNRAFKLDGLDGPTVGTSKYSRRTPNWDDPEENIEGIRRSCWGSLVERLELRRMMSIERWKQLEKTLDEEALPEITEEHVRAFVAQQRSTLPDMLKEAIYEVHEWLRPHEGSRGADYVRNSQYEVPRRIAITSIIRSGTFDRRFDVCDYRHQYLTALENVFSGLDGQGQINKHHYSVLHTAIKQIAVGSGGVAETTYFRAKPHKNGSLHLEFLRPDLLARFNAIAGGKRLKPEAA